MAFFRALQFYDRVIAVESYLMILIWYTLIYQEYWFLLNPALNHLYIPAPIVDQLEW